MNLWRVSLIAVCAFLGGARAAEADWRLTPFAGAAFRTNTGFLDLDGVAARRHATYGLSLALLPEGIFGGDVGVSWTPSAFTGHDLVESSRVVTATGAAIIALPQRWSRVVRPYATIGVGVLNVTSTDIAGIFPIDSTRFAGAAGLGAWVPLGRRFGVRADARFLRTASDPESTRFETWQSTLGATLRF
jgi:hypothetical protein